MESLFVARDFRELHSYLRSIDAEVPVNPKDRKNSQVENYTLVSVLASIPWKHTSFPLEVLRRERPDFCIRCNLTEIGLEHTEATNENLTQERILRAEGHGPDVHFVSPASIRDTVKKKNQILGEILADEPEPPWCGDFTERNWVEAMAHFINKKSASACKNGYQRYGDNRLMIYDNWPAPALKHS